MKNERRLLFTDADFFPNPSEEQIAALKKALTPTPKLKMHILSETEEKSGFNYFQDIWNKFEPPYAYPLKEKYNMLSEKLQDKGYSYSEVFEFLRSRGYHHFTSIKEDLLNHKILNDALIESDFIRPDFSERISFFSLPRRVGYTHFLKNMNRFLETGQAENPIKE